MWPAGLDLIPVERRDDWRSWVEAAAGEAPATFNPNGYTVPALQAAWAAITSTDHRSDDPTHLERGIHAAVGAGNDTDTVAAIAGALLGARHGAAAVPDAWAPERPRLARHGGPGPGRSRGPHRRQWVVADLG